MATITRAHSTRFVAICVDFRAYNIGGARYGALEVIACTPTNATASTFYAAEFEAVHAAATAHTQTVHRGQLQVGRSRQ